jgi:DNA-binding XRE family transcriptional regulator
MKRLTRLREWRDRRLLSQAEPRSAPGLSELTISRIENGLHQRRFSTIANSPRRWALIRPS